MGISIKKSGSWVAGQGLKLTGVGGGMKAGVTMGAPPPPPTSPIVFAGSITHNVTTISWPEFDASLGAPTLSGGAGWTLVDIDKENIPTYDYNTHIATTYSGNQFSYSFNVSAGTGLAVGVQGPFYPGTTVTSGVYDGYFVLGSSGMLTGQWTFEDGDMVGINPGDNLYLEIWSSDDGLSVSGRLAFLRIYIDGGVI